ncbi:MAG: hypothetical protein QG670_2266 [Thermoproteota archaeon]|nr:hypothetical protein [Thermoproteota archaeon]
MFISSYWEKYRLTIISLSIIFSLGLVSLTWFKDSLLIMWDKTFPLNPGKALSDNIYIWLDFATLGTVNTRAVTLTQENLLIVFLERIGLSIVQIQMVFYYSLLTFAGISMYFLSNQFPAGKMKHLLSLLSSVIYMFNPFAAIFVWGTSLFPPFDPIFYAFLPLILGLYIKVIRERRGLRYVVFLSLIWTLVLTPAYVNPVNLILTLIALFLFDIAYVAEGARRRSVLEHVSFLLKFSLKLGLIWIALNSFWLIPVVAFSKIELANIFPIGGDAFSFFQASSATLIDTMRSMPFWGLGTAYKGDILIPLSNFYTSPFFTIISFILLFLVFIPVIFRRLVQGRVIFFYFFYLFSVALASGTNSPLGNLVPIVLNSLGLLEAFRLPSLKFGVYVSLSYSYLLGLALATILSVSLNYIRRKKSSFQSKYSEIFSLGHFARQLTCVLVFSLVLTPLLIYGYPSLSNEIIYPGGRVIPSSRVQVPSYYFDAKNWLYSQYDDFNILSLPITKEFVAYSWNGGIKGFVGQQPESWLFPQQVISLDVGSGLVQYITDIINNNGTFGIRNQLLSLMNIRYVLIHNDTNWSFMQDNIMWPTTSGELIQSFFNTQTNLSIVQSFGEIGFYKNEYWQPMHVYGATKCILINGGLNQIVNFIQRTDFRPEETILLFADQLDAQQISTLPKDTILVQAQNDVKNLTYFNNLYFSHLTGNISLTFEKINPTKYVVHIVTSTPFSLVLSESYDKSWIATIDRQQLSDQNHFKANGYANGWYINRTGTYTVTLEFWPQNLFYIGLAISVTTLILCIFYILKDKLRQSISNISRILNGYF